ncbi:DUF6326 family protein [Actinoplanes sp. CA-131856]
MKDVDTRIALCGLWITTLFVFAYVDIFGFYRADVINGVLAGEVSGTGLAVSQTFLTLTTLYIAAAASMVVVSLLAPARVNRLANIVAGLFYAATVAATLIGESWIYYIVGSLIEIILLLAITRIAWTWPKSAEPKRLPQE